MECSCCMVTTQARDFLNDILSTRPPFFKVLLKVFCSAMNFYRIVFLAGGNRNILLGEPKYVPIGSLCSHVTTSDLGLMRFAFFCTFFPHIGLTYSHLILHVPVPRILRSCPFLANIISNDSFWYPLALFCFPP